MRPSHRRILAATIAAVMERRDGYGRPQTFTVRTLARTLEQRDQDVLAALKTLQAEDLAAPVAGGKWWKLLPLAEQALAEGRKQLQTEGVAS